MYLSLDQALLVRSTFCALLGALAALGVAAGWSRCATQVLVLAFLQAHHQARVMLLSVICHRTVG